MGAIKAVFRSWDNPRANVFIVVITISLIPGVLLLTFSLWHSVTWVMTVVPVLHLPEIRLPVLRACFGEFLTNAQGEDVVAGVRTPMKIAEMADKFPEAFAQFQEVCKTLEDHYRDMQDMSLLLKHGKAVHVTDQKW